MNNCVLHIYMPEAEQRQQHKEGGGLRASGEAKKASSSPSPSSIHPPISCASTTCRALCYGHNVDKLDTALPSWD